MIRLPRRLYRLPKLGFSALAFLMVILLLLFKLGSLPAFLTASEQAAKAGSHLGALASNPMFLPWHLIQDVFLKISDSSIFLARLPSVIFALGVLGAFYWSLSTWFGKQIGYLATILLGTTPLFLILARQGLPDIMYFSPVLLMAAFLLTLRTKEKLALPLTCLVISLAVCLYVPGGIWLVSLGLVFRWSDARELVAELNRRTQLIALAGWLVLIAPLVIVSVKHPHVIRSIFLIPTHFNWLSGLKNWGWMLASLAVKTRSSEALTLGQLPILDAAQISLAVFGGYVMWSKLRAQFYWLAGLVLFICLGAGLAGGFTTLALALPLLSILVGMGLRYLYVEWRHVFPRNPIPRYFAIALMAAVVFMHVLYGVRYGLIAWPTHIAANTVHMLK